MQKIGRLGFVGISFIFVGLLMTISWIALTHPITSFIFTVLVFAVFLTSVGVILLTSFIIKEKNQLQHLAFHDPLTGVANRNKLESHLSAMLINSKRRKENFAIILLDLDHFKHVNDSIGHDAGDTLLQVVADRLKNTVRSTDLIARLGGDEFMIIIPDPKNAESVAEIAQKILQSTLQPILIQGHEIFITTSIGICLFPMDGDEAQTLVKNADLALYRAKDLGRNNFQFCTVEMTRKAHDKMAKQMALNHALIKQEFMLVYQPSLDVKTKKINNIEALLRWDSKEYGLVMHDTIINLAEETGAIIPLSDWVLRTACQQVKAWHKAGFEGMTLSINVSSRHFKQADFIDKIKMVLEALEFPAHCLVLDITEGLIIHNRETVLRTMQALRKMGIQIVIDNFGTGYSSFAYLKDFPLDKVKIDKGFIQQIVSDQASFSLVAAMIAMSTKLGIRIVAEGVETQEQFDLLVKEGCAEIQGYYVAKPMTAEKTLEYLSQPTFVKF